MDRREHAARRPGAHTALIVLAALAFLFATCEVAVRNLPGAIRAPLRSQVERDVLAMHARAATKRAPLRGLAILGDASSREAAALMEYESSRSSFLGSFGAADGNTLARLGDVRAALQYSEVGPACAGWSERAMGYLESDLRDLGSDGDGGECLRLMTDYVRLAADLSVGCGADTRAILFTHAVSYASPIVVACAQRATPTDRRTAVRELLALNASVPPLRAALAQDITIACRQVDFDLEAAMPSLSADVVAQTRTAANLLEIANVLCYRSSFWRSPTFPSYPADIASAARADVALGPIGFASFARYRFHLVLTDDAKALAMLRSMVVAVAAMAMTDADGTVPIAAPRETSLSEIADPFSSAPLRYSRTGPRTFEVYSVGPNRRDDGAIRRSANDDDIVTNVP